MRSIVITLIAVVAGIGAGFALSPATWTAIAASQQAEELPAVSAGPLLIDVTTLVSDPNANEIEARLAIGRALDTVLVDNGYEVRVHAGGGDQLRVLIINGSFGRVSTMKLARQFDFGSLHRAGFKVFITNLRRESQGYLIDDVMAEGRLRAPLDDYTLDMARETMEDL